MPEIESKDFYLVGIGASAGGLDVIPKLFDHIPSNTGIAFAMAQGGIKTIKESGGVF
jgi:two-component system CheB/CheR fusion protein